MCLHKARLAASTFLCSVDTQQWPQYCMAVSVGPRVSSFLLQMLSKPLVGTVRIFYFAPPLCVNT